MTYRLVFEERPSEGNRAKDVGENVFLANLPYDYKVYAFYYSGNNPDDTLEDKLRELGNSTGTNLLVNIGGRNDPEYGEIATRFEIERHPVIIVTAVDALASRPGEYVSAYARLDSPHLLASADRTVRCVEELFNLFIREKVSEAISHGKWQQRAELVRSLTSFFTGALKALGSFVGERDIAFSVIEGKFELKRSGG